MPGNEACRIRTVVVESVLFSYYLGYTKVDQTVIEPTQIRCKIRCYRFELKFDVPVFFLLFLFELNSLPICLFTEAHSSSGPLDFRKVNRLKLITKTQI